MNTHQAMIVVDYQNDFAHPNGSLYVREGELLVPYINDLMAKIRSQSGVVITSQDWHPQDHTSFASAHGKNAYETLDTPNGSQTLWPNHCVQNTWGADFLE